MRPLLAALALACLAGCASTPQDLRDTGLRTDHALTLPATQAAGCIARNVENHSMWYAAALRPMAEAGKFEVVVRMPEAPIFGVMYLIEVEPSGAASRAMIWGPKPTSAQSNAEDDFRRAVPKGC